MVKIGSLGKLMIIALVLAAIMVSVHSNPSQSQGADYNWWTLGGSPYRDASVPLVYKGNYNNNINIKWTYTLYNTQTRLGFSISTNPLVVDLDHDGKAEIIFTDDAGEMLVLSGQTGNELARFNVLASPFSTPAILDVDNDNMYEIFISSRHGTVICYRLDTATWSVTKVWESEILGQMLPSSPLVEDVNGDGSYEVMVLAPSGFYMLNSITGTIITHIERSMLVLGTSPSLVGDVDNDGITEVVIVDSYGLVMLIDPITGQIQWSNDLGTSYDGLILHSPVVGDVDGDDNNEIIVSMGLEIFDWIPGTNSGSTSTGVKVAKTGTMGRIIILDSLTGALEASLTYNGGALFAWFYQPSIAIGDVNGDNINDIVLSSGDGYLYFITYSGGTYNVNQVAQLDTYWPRQMSSDAPPVSASVLLIDINGDGREEIIAYSTDNRGGGYSLDYTLYIIDSNLNIVDQVTINTNNFGINDNDLWVFSWPSISSGDVDGDGFLELVVVAYQGVVCFDW